MGWILTNHLATRPFRAWMGQHFLGRKRLLDTLIAATYSQAEVTSIWTTNPRDFAVFGCFQCVTPREIAIAGTLFVSSGRTATANEAWKILDQLFVGCDEVASGLQCDTGINNQPHWSRASRISDIGLDAAATG